MNWLRDAGAEIVEVSLPHTKYGLPTYYIAALAEASSNLARYDGLRFGERVSAPSLDGLYEASRAAGFDEETLIAAGHAIEQAAAFRHRPTIHAGVSASTLIGNRGA